MHAVSGLPLPYTQPFIEACHSALTSNDPVTAAVALFRHPLYKRAHPSPEHLLPLVVAVAAANDGDEFEELYSDYDGLGWAMYRWH